jgi:hypothetical protein
MKLRGLGSMKSFWSIIKDAFRLDIFDLSFAWSSEAMGQLGLPFADTVRKGILLRFFAFLLHMFGALARALRVKIGRPDRGGILLFATTKNQRDSLLRLRSIIPRTYLAGCYTEVDQSFPLLLSHIISIPFFPLVVFQYWKGSGYERRSFQYNLDNYWLTYGAYIACWLWLARLAPRALLFSNDHNTLNRIAMKCAQRHNIPTIYLQHASVTAQFPPLGFDYAFLEGRDAAKKYDEAGASRAKVLLVGMAKLDEYAQYVNQNNKAHSLGICTNTFDPIQEVSALCAELKRQCPQLRLVLRQHPSDIRVAQWQAVSNKLQMDFSDSRCEEALSFLRRVDAIIAAESSIHLEAALMNVYPLYYAYNGQFLDWYGYGANRLYDYCASRADVLEKVRCLMREKPYVRNRAKLYCETVETKYDGRSSDLIRSEVERIALAAPELNVGWIRDSSYQKLQVYVPGDCVGSIRG